MALSAGRPSKKVSSELNLDDVTDNPKKQVRVNFNLDKDKHRALKQLSLDSQKSISQLLTEAVDQMIAKR
ncbi:MULTISPECIES: chromosome partitioning protein ParB [Psychrobacter]|uniref:chromosome partitioning protein ParB n=1 Tax=Psychrobacter TaxID=497 RepID=UPI00146CACB8|nr:MULTISPECIES: chromosome partitioning protein ParB [Psychrobacter]